MALFSELAATLQKPSRNSTSSWWIRKSVKLNSLVFFADGKGKLLYGVVIKVVG